MEAYDGLRMFEQFEKMPWYGYLPPATEFLVSVENL